MSGAVLMISIGFGLNIRVEWSKNHKIFLESRQTNIVCFFQGEEWNLGFCQGISGQDTKHGRTLTYFHPLETSMIPKSTFFHAESEFHSPRARNWVQAPIWVKKWIWASVSNFVEFGSSFVWVFLSFSSSFRRTKLKARFCKTRKNSKILEKTPDCYKLLAADNA